jgi:RNA polymerase sigma-70 factor, ECF subfamily
MPAGEDRFPREEYEGLVRAWHGFVYRYLYWLCHNRDLAEDLTQETFLRAWRGLPSRSSGRCADRAWLIVIARRAAVDHARQRRVQALSLQDVPDLADSEPSPAEQLMRHEANRQLHQAVRSLPAAYRMAVVLTKVEALSTAEAARAMGVPQGTVKWRVARGLRLLRERLNDDPSTSTREVTHDANVELRP